MANGSVQVLGGGQVKLPNGDVWRGHTRAVEARPDTVTAPTEQERSTNKELTEAALAIAALTPKTEK